MELAEVCRTPIALNGEDSTDSQPSFRVWLGHPDHPNNWGVVLGIDASRGELSRVKGGTPRFFFRSEDIARCVTAIRERLPRQAETIFQYAEKICRHCFDLLGYEDLDYGREIDCHFTGQIVVKSEGSTTMLA